MSGVAASSPTKATNPPSTQRVMSSLRAPAATRSHPAGDAPERPWPALARLYPFGLPMTPMRMPSHGYVTVNRALSWGWSPTAESHSW